MNRYYRLVKAHVKCIWAHCFALQSTLLFLMVIAELVTARGPFLVFTQRVTLVDISISEYPSVPYIDHRSTVQQRET